MDLFKTAPGREREGVMTHVVHLFSLVDISTFSPEISNFCYIKKCIYQLHFNTELLILLTSFEFLRLLRKTRLQLMVSENWLLEAFSKKVFQINGNDA